MSPRPKPVTFSEFLLLIRTKYSTLPTTVLKQKPKWLPFPGFPPCPQMLTFCWIPFLTRVSFPVLIIGFNHQLNADDSQIPTSSLVISPEHQTPVAICLLSIPTWMSQPSPSPKTCSSSYILYSRWSWLTSCSTVLCLPFMHQHRCFTGLEGLPFSSKLASLPLTWDPSPPR